MNEPRELSLAALDFLELGPPAFLDVAAGAGFSSVSLRTWAAVPGGLEYPLLEGGRLSDATRERMDATGVTILQIELVSLARDVEIESYRPVLEGGAALGAGRVVACGDDEDGVVVERLAELCDRAAELGMSVDVEFMPFRDLATLPQALDVVARAERDNACVMVDALHLFRSGSSVASVAVAPPSRIGVCQLCDALLAAPAPDLLATEAREQRLLPGDGELPLRDLVQALPAGVSLAAEVPNRVCFAGMPPADRARLVYQATSALL
ncbi:MAG: sugar phosphate isomerase/epimerase [Thermoleophilia bacterium]|nr:sugar phosphate isomerase/epimerase [Thermoleophilia bacterium]